MALFRKVFRILIPGAICAACAGIAAAQQFQCFANSGVSTPARHEGVTELVGDLVLNCTGGTPTPQGAPIPTVNIQIFLNTSATSKLLAGNWSEALLMIDEPLPAIQRVCGTSGDLETQPG